MAEHLVGVQGLIIAVPCAVYVINHLILGNGDETVNSGDTRNSSNINESVNKSAAGSLDKVAQNAHPMTM